MTPPIATGDSPYAQPTLVVLINNWRDWQRVVDEHWYRLPVRYAPLPAAALYLAFYRTRVFGSEAWQVGYYAPVLRYELLCRRAIVPDEPDHPRADELYYRIALGPAERLTRPVPSRRLRRVTFIPTTLERLLTAADVADLWLVDDSAALVWHYFPDAARKALHRLPLAELPAERDEADSG